MVLDWDEPRPALSESVLDTLRRRYGLAPVRAPRDLGGAFSLNVLVETAAGRYVARVHGSQTGPQRLAAIQSVRRHLAAGGVPVSPPVAAQDGATFVWVGGHLLEVERYVEHDVFMNTWPRLVHGLPWLGRVHTLLRSAPVTAAGREPLIANHIEPAAALAGTLRGVQRLRGLELTPDERDLVSAYEELAHLVDAVERDLTSELPRQPVHGDFWDNNVLFHSGRVVLVGDLDFMGERRRIDDLALTLFFANSSIGGDRLGDERLRQLRQVVDAYDSGLADRLSPTERTAIPPAIARQPLWTMGRHVVEVPGAERARRLAAERAADVRWTLALMRDLTRWQEAFL